MSKKTEMAVTDEMAFNDMRMFLETMKIKQERVDRYMEDPAVKDFLPNLFKGGLIRLEAETNCLIQTLDDGRELKIYPVRPTQRDLNLVKPQGYDKMDADTKELVNVSFLTKIPHRILLEEYLVSDLELAKNMCYFF